MFRLALVQMRVDGGSRNGNIERAVERVAASAAAGAEVVLLPEALDLGWTHPSAQLEAGRIPDGFACAQLSEAARQHSVYVCAGLVERYRQQIFNSAVLIGPDGGLLLHHRKLNELEIGHATYAQGNRLAVSSTPLATFGLMICSDAFVRGQEHRRGDPGVRAGCHLRPPCLPGLKPRPTSARHPDLSGPARGFQRPTRVTPILGHPALMTQAAQRG
jgi:predicted amidohydrolase